VNETEVSTCPYLGHQTDTNIKWILLKDTQGISQGGINTVYRIETAGGNKPHTCRGQKPDFTVDYVAQCT
jgi:hypothetical protein